MNLNERISKIMEYSELTASEFADVVDVQRSSISHITSGRNKPSLDFLIKVKDQFPEIQWEWLIRGAGEMIETTTSTHVKEETTKSTSSLPDLFSLLEDEITDSIPQNKSNEVFSEKNVTDISNARESSISDKPLEYSIISDSQQLGCVPQNLKNQTIDIQENKVIKIVMFYDNGKFEIFTP